MAVEKLRQEVAVVTDWRGQLRANQKNVLIGAAVAGFVLGGGIAGVGGLLRAPAGRALARVDLLAGLLSSHQHDRARRARPRGLEQHVVRRRRRSTTATSSTRKACGATTAQSPWATHANVSISGIRVMLRSSRAGVRGSGAGGRRAGRRRSGRRAGRR